MAAGTAPDEGKARIKTYIYGGMFTKCCAHDNIYLKQRGIIMTEITRIRESIHPVAKKYGLRRVYLFGSYARGEADEQSDIDLLIEKGTPLSMLSLSGLRIECMERLGTDVDIVTTSGIEKEFYDEIHGSEVLIYEG